MGPDWQKVPNAKFWGGEVCVCKMPLLIQHVSVENGQNLDQLCILGERKGFGHICGFLSEH